MLPCCSLLFISDEEIAGTQWECDAQPWQAEVATTEHSKRCQTGESALVLCVSVRTEQRGLVDGQSAEEWEFSLSRMSGCFHKSSTILKKAASCSKRSNQGCISGCWAMILSCCA